MSIDLSQYTHFTLLCTRCNAYYTSFRFSYVMFNNVYLIPEKKSAGIMTSLFNYSRLDNERQTVTSPSHVPVYFMFQNIFH